MCATNCFLPSACRFEADSPLFFFDGGVLGYPTSFSVDRHLASQAIMRVPQKSIRHLGHFLYPVGCHNKTTPYFLILAEISSILSMGSFARSRNCSSSSTNGHSYLRQLYSFSRVLRRIYAHSLQAHPPLIGGTGMNVFWGQHFCISCSIPLSVATINVSHSSLFAYESIAAVEPT